ncbi:hypothetical protein GCM10023188_27990 [Pontibacter saemangeumensis]|uniref:Uncharacterized protein n=1 Tax=Pontibacter saemangeumensis TaxID=1084525 RepID=A0ABP8LVR6_9BACT
MADKKDLQNTTQSILTEEQEALLDLYIQSLDSFREELRASEKIQVEIETQHLKKILRT